MHHFTYRSGVLHAEDVPIPQIAAAVGTPFYCYSSATLARHYAVFADALKGLDAAICFAVKSNTNLAVIRTLVGLGAGCDVVSGGELQLALKAGCPAAKIVFSGVGKTEAELRLAVACDVGQINVESEAELDTLSRIAAGMGKTVRIALRVVWPIFKPVDFGRQLGSGSGGGEGVGGGEEGGGSPDASSAAARGAAKRASRG